MAWMMISRAETAAFSRASSSMRRTVWMASSRASSSIFRMSCALGLLLGQAGDPLELGHLLLEGLADPGLEGLDLLFLGLEALLLLGEIALLPLDGLEAPLEVLLLVDEPALRLGDLLPLLAGLVLELGLAAEVLSLAVIAASRLIFSASSAARARIRLGLLLDLRDAAGGVLPLEGEDDDGRQQGDDDGAAGVDDDRLFTMLTSLCDHRRRDARRKGKASHGG